MTISSMKAIVKALNRLLLSATVVVVASVVILAQASNQNTNRQVPERVFAPQAVVPGERTSADETFVLNIVERHYSQETFKASTALEKTLDANRLALQVGVALASTKIDVVLRNVHGVVRFRGTLDRLLQIIRDRQAQSPPDSPVPPTKNE